jgi:hypothetical protein
LIRFFPVKYFLDHLDVLELVVLVDLLIFFELFVELLLDGGFLLTGVVDLQNHESFFDVCDSEIVQSKFDSMGVRHIIQHFFT